MRSWYSHLSSYSGCLRYALGSVDFGIGGNGGNGVCFFIDSLQVVLHEGIEEGGAAGGFTRRLGQLEQFALGDQFDPHPERKETLALVPFQSAQRLLLHDAMNIFKAAVQSRPEILECHLVAGGFDYLIKTRVADMQAYREFVGSVIWALPGVRETRTYAVMEEVKNTTMLPI